MNYIALRKLIIGITAAALLVSICALAVGLLLPRNQLDLQGASGLASIIPAFAGVLIAAFALYSYNKLEDADYAKARQLVGLRDELTAQLRLLAYSVASAARMDADSRKIHQGRLTREFEESGSFLGVDGKRHTHQDKAIVMKTIRSHAAEIGRNSANLHLRSALAHLEEKVVEGATLLTPLVLDHFKDEPKKVMGWLTNLLAITYGCKTVDQPHDRLSGMANIVRSSGRMVELLKTPFFSSVEDVYNSLVGNKGGLDVPDMVVDILNKVDADFERLANPS